MDVWKMPFFQGLFLLVLGKVKPNQNRNTILLANLNFLVLNSHCDFPGIQPKITQRSFMVWRGFHVSNEKTLVGWLRG